MRRERDGGRKKNHVGGVKQAAYGVRKNTFRAPYDANESGSSLSILAKQHAA
jgi:hypothetical protein